MAIPFETEALEAAPSLATMLTRKLREEIESRRIKSGERFPSDAEIAAAFGVSRTVVREAVSSLREAGLISTQRGRGSVVVANSPSPSFRIAAADLESMASLRQLYEFRTLIEKESAFLAAQRRTDEDLQAQRACLDQAAEASDLDESIEADIAFHLAIATAAQNEYFCRVLSTLRTATIARALMREDLDENARLALYKGEVQDEHRQIFEAIQRRDSNAAQDLIERHLGGTRLMQLSNSRD
ncbi:FadR family transcriptional regulator [Aureimonas fodinaquatilis]|uniref:FadR family transcriptional regulator n=1 Tax=Aureimonas fodinaquatilis TaxID=2565783 RepID=A0A5B0E0J1_9HYPH|nr:FadR/GntR family transcriptional regulator [Aureimonas fodinaquatilis]KAA0970989.1 FadR family transcriptional regulator [Aureimonas fodinaquatilis]